MRRHLGWILVGSFAFFLAGVLGGCGDSGGGATQEVDAGQPDAARLITREEVLTACLRSDGCGVMPYGYLSHCVTSHYDDTFETGTVQIWSDLYRCVNAAGGDCPTIRKCYGGGEEPQGCRGIEDGYCDGMVQVTCDTMDRKLYHFDCAAASLQCSIGAVAGGNEAPFCGYGPCDPVEWAPYCQENLLLTCDNGYINVRDCQARGLVCGGEGSSMSCVGAGPACDQNFVPTCEGDVLTKCYGGTTAVIDCTALPGRKRCDEAQEDCVPAGQECTGGEVCEGTVAKVCLDGFWASVDCTEIGFRTCVVEGGAGVHCSL